MRRRKRLRRSVVFYPRDARVKWRGDAKKKEERKREEEAEECPRKAERD